MTAEAIASPIDEGRRLVSEGRLLEALPHLTRANREHRDPQLERELVNLRHAAFAELRPVPPPAVWPPELPDHFPGIDGLPEVDASDLTADLVTSGIFHHGSLIVRGLFSAERSATLRDDIDRAFAGCEAWEEGAKPNETLPHFARFTPRPRLQPGPSGQLGAARWRPLCRRVPRTVFDLLEAIDELGLGDVLEQYLGERPALSVKKWTLRRVPVDSGTNWHQDGAFLGEVRTVNLWVALSACGVHSPTVDIVARRLDHLVETGSGGAYFDWSVGQEVVDRERGNAPIVRPHFEAGDAMLFDDYNLHRTATAPEMTEARYAIESWFFAPPSYPSAQIPIVF